MNFSVSLNKFGNNSYNDTKGLHVPVSSAIFQAIGASMSVFFVIALTENILVLYVYKRTKKLHTRTNYWIISVITCDLFIVVNAFPFVIISSFAEEYIFGDIGCKWDGFIVTLFGTSSIFLLTGISLHRYIIIFGSQPQVKTGNHKTILAIFLCFLLGFIWALSPILGWGSYSLEGLRISCAPNWKSTNISDKSYTLSMFVIVLFIPCILMAFCYMKILFKVWHERRIHSEWIRRRNVKREIKVTISVGLTIGSFLLSWTPYAAVSLCESVLDIDVYRVSWLLVQLPCLMAKTACMVNPVVYVCHNSDFKKAFKEMFQSSRNKSLDLTRNYTCKVSNDNSGGVPI